MLGPSARGDEARLVYWYCEIEASRAAKTRCFLASCSLMGRKTGQPQQLAVGSGRCLRWRWRCVRFPAALLAAPTATTATPFAGGLHMLLQCFPGFLLFPLVVCFLCRCPCFSPPSHSKPGQTTGTPWRQEKESAGGIADLSAAQRVQSRFRSFRRSICREKSRQPRGHFGGSKANNGRYRQQVDGRCDQQQRI